MTGEMFSAESLMWSCLWQSTIFLAAGLLVSFLLRRHSARAHRVLFLAMIAAIIVPAGSLLVNHYELGMFVAEPAVIQPPSENHAIHETSDIIFNEAIEHNPAPINEDLHSAMSVSEAAKFPWRSALIYTWIAASLILAARLLVTFVSGVRLLRRAQTLNNDKIEQAIHLAKTELGISKEVQIYNSDKIHSPVIWCWRSTPVLLVPTRANQSGNKIDWAGVLCHELAHYKRRDHVAGLLAELTVCLLPWHPLLWWAKSHLISLSEQACDDWVVASGQSGTDYAESLLNLIPEEQMAFVPAVVTSKRGLTGRVCRILQEKCANPQAGIIWALTVSIVALCLTAGIAFAQTRPLKTEGQNAEEIESSRQRVISFPEDRSMGKLFVRDAGFDSWYEGWQELGEARGGVSVDAGKEVKLQVNEEAAGDLSALTKLRADDLQMLSFGWKAMKVGSLEPIGKLKGLKALNIQRARFDSEDFKHLTGLDRLEVLRCGDHKLTNTSMRYVGQLTSLRSLALWGTGISDEGLKYLQGLANLTFLALNGCEITDRGLDYLRNMTALEGLQIYHTKITDNGLKKLQGLTRLKHIKLDGNGITDTGLRHIENLTLLENIWINSNPITDKGLSYFAGMKKLKELYASDTKITDAGLINLRGLKDFRHLLIDGIGDEGIALLSKLSALEMLQIQDASVTKESVPHFKRMASIEEVLLSGDKINDDLLDALRKALPNCKIWDPQRSREYHMTTWRQRFEQVYRLDGDEILKRIAPPFIPERKEYFSNERPSQAKRYPEGPAMMIFHWRDNKSNLSYTLNHPNFNLSNLFQYIFKIGTPDMWWGDTGNYYGNPDGPEQLLGMKLPGDWIIRNEAPPEAKIQAIEKLIADQFGHNITIRSSIEQRDVIVVTGQFKFSPVYSNDTIVMYADEDESVREKCETILNGTNTIGQFLQHLEWLVSVPVIDKTKVIEDTRIEYRAHLSNPSIRCIKNFSEKKDKLRFFLDTLSAQTNLQFEITREPIEVWFITEETKN